MKSLILVALVSTLAQSTFASSGKIKVVTNDDESVMIITGDAARELYNKLDVPAVNARKAGRDLRCSLTGEDVFTCSMKLEESDGSGAKFTGVVGQ
jgi:hypothetical protein